MPDCPFYNTHTKYINSGTISADRQKITRATDISWCSHEESPATFKHATSVFGGASLLKCGGTLKNCQISPERLEAQINRDE